MLLPLVLDTAGGKAYTLHAHTPAPKPYRRHQLPPKLLGRGICQLPPPITPYTGAGVGVSGTSGEAVASSVGLCHSQLELVGRACGVDRIAERGPV